MKLQLAQWIALLIGSGGGGGLAAYLLTLRQRRRQMDATARDTESTADARIMAAAATLVEQAGTQVPALVERITKLEAARDALSTDLAALRAEQDDERAELAAWRTWGAQQREWSTQAVSAIRALGGDIPDPPPPPRRVAAMAV